jgi:hypothetical protein
MPGPTAEVLNEDVKELKTEIRDIRGDVHRVDVSLTRVQTEFAFAKWFLGLLLLATISGIGSGIWWAASITADLKNLSSRFDERFQANDTRLDKVEARLGKVEERFDKIQERFDKIEITLSKIADQTRPK